MGTTRDRILDAAAEIMRTRGIVRATTKEIAKAAGFSEATLYKHFRDKEELLLRVLRERMPGFATMDIVAGESTVEDNLYALVRGSLDFYRRAFPMLGSLLSEPQLMAAHRESLRKYGAGPARAVENITGYLEAERKLGRIPADADPAAVGALLAGACFQQAFLAFYAEGPDAAPVPDPTATALTKALIRSLSLG